MDKLMLMSHINALKAQFEIDLLPRARDQYEVKAFSSIKQHLEQIEYECRTGHFVPKQQRYGYIARLVTELDPDILPPDFGGELIEIEKTYRNL